MSHFGAKSTGETPFTAEATWAVMPIGNNATRAKANNCLADLETQTNMRFSSAIHPWQMDAAMNLARQSHLS
jgi:hypothetical protein